MAIDLAALRAKIAAQKAVTPTPAPTTPVAPIPQEDLKGTVAVVATTAEVSVPIPTINPPDVLGTSKTSEIDHLDFISKMNSLSEAIHKQHPTMPVLLMQIHKQLRNDPELVTTLDEAAIGIVVKGLQVQTKTELVAEVVKKTTSGRKKNSGVSLDML